jgi:hypothetical protein
MEDKIIYVIVGIIFMLATAIFRVWQRRVGITGDYISEEQGLSTEGVEKAIEKALPEKTNKSKPLSDEEWDAVMEGDEITKMKEGTE